MQSQIINQAIENNKFYIQVGSADVFINNPTEENIKFEIKALIKNTFFESDFYYNFLPTKLQDNYLQFFNNKILLPLLNDIDNFIENYTTLKFTPSSIKRKLFVINNDINFYELFENDIDLLQAVKIEFQLYNFKQAGKKLSPNKYEYFGEWPSCSVKIK